MRDSAYLIGIVNSHMQNIYIFQIVCKDTRKTLGSLLAHRVLTGSLIRPESRYVSASGSVGSYGPFDPLTPFRSVAVVLCRLARVIVRHPVYLTTPAISLVMSTREENVSKLVSATNAFDLFFANDLAGARKAFGEQDSPFHQLGLGVTAFLEAALGMEASLHMDALGKLLF
jgi:hypothetical protein